MSILPYKDGAYVAQGSELFFLNDANKDGKADVRTPLLTGFGFTDTHTMAHVLMRAPGDWIHFSHGALNKGEVTSLKSGAKLKIDYSKIVRMSLDAEKNGTGKQRPQQYLGLPDAERWAVVWVGGQ